MASHGSALFVHGLWMTGAESLLLRRRLGRQGWRLPILPYSSMVETLDAVAARIARRLQALERATGQPVQLVGHSLGGLAILRMFELGLHPEPTGDCAPRRIVLLGSPVNGSRIGRVLAGKGPLGLLLGRAGGEALGKEAREPYAWHFPAELGLIAGNRPQGAGRLITRFAGPNDGTVAVSETLMQGEGAHCVLPVGHMGLLASEEVARQLITFLDHGHFDAATR